MQCAGEHGVYRTAKVLGLDYGTLKRRVALKSGGKPSAVGFVELAVPRPPECVVEFAGACGQLTIRLTGHSPADVVALAETLARA